MTVRGLDMTSWPVMFVSCFLKLLAMVCVGTMSGDAPVTVTVSAMFATFNVTSTVVGSAIFTLTSVRLSV
jgi:hypothetical protein